MLLITSTEPIEPSLLIQTLYEPVTTLPRRCALTTSGRCGSSPELILSFLIRIAGTTLGLGGGLGSSLGGGGGGAPTTPPATPPSTPPTTPSEEPPVSFSSGGS